MNHKLQQNSYDIEKINDIEINTKFLGLFRQHNLVKYDDFIKLSHGKLFRENELRSVVEFELLNESDNKFIFHIKRHALNIKETIKSICNCFNAFDGENEWKMILYLHSAGIRTMVPVAFGMQRKFMLPWKSFTVTEHLYNTKRLEDFLQEDLIHKSDKFQVKKKITLELASVSSKFHKLGMVHQDFYLGHFFINTNNLMHGDFNSEISDSDLFLIDLQRVYKPFFAFRKKIKDLAQLYFSSTMFSCVTNIDRMRFYKIYSGRNKRLSFYDKLIIKIIISKALKIQKHTDKVLSKSKVDKNANNI